MSRPSPDAPRLPLRARLMLALLRWRARTPLAMARYAARHTRFFRAFYDGCDLSDFGALPVLRKSMVRDVPPLDLLSDEHTQDVAYYGETTGSSGSPTPVFLTPKEFHGATLLARLSPWHPVIRDALAENRLTVNGLASGFTIAGLSFGDVLKNLGGIVANVGSRSTLATPERTARAIARLAPSIVAATPLDFLAWMRIVNEDWPDRYPVVVDRLKLLLSTAELCAGSRARGIEREFGIQVVDTYACVEGFFTLACRCGEKHVLDAYHVELLDEALKPMGPVGRGRLAFTNLLKESSPLVRYLLDDDATLGPSDCPYGFRQSVVPHGRWELGTTIGGRRWNVRDFEEEIFRVGLYGDYTVDVRDDGIDVEAEAYADGTESTGDALRARLEEATGCSVGARVVPFGTLSPPREVRQSKPIWKIRDRRATSRQKVPEFL